MKKVTEERRWAGVRGRHLPHLPRALVTTKQGGATRDRLQLRIPAHTSAARGFRPEVQTIFLGGWNSVRGQGRGGRGLMEWNSRLFYSFELYYAPPFLDNSAMKLKLLRKSGHGAILFAGNLISKYSNEQERTFGRGKRICADTHTD